MWSEILSQVRDKFDTLREQGWDAFVPADLEDRSDVIRLYDRLTWEMVEGLSSLVLEMIRNQNYVARLLPVMDTRIYQQAHVTIMDKVQECVSDEVTTLLEFYVLLRDSIDQFHGYCRLLKQDISYHFHRYSHLQKDRRFRQINLTLRETLTALKRFRDRCDLLLKKMGGQDADALLENLQPDPIDLMELLEEADYSGEEKERLRKWMENRDSAEE